MKMSQGKLLAAGLTASLIMAASAAPALGQCIKKHPLFGIDIYVNDKECPKKKAVKKKSANTEIARLKTSSPGKTAARTIKLPNANPEVKEMQSLLTQLGYKPGSADGIQGPATTNALNLFYAAMGLPETTSRDNTLVLLHRAAGN